MEFEQIISGLKSKNFTKQVVPLIESTTSDKLILSNLTRIIKIGLDNDCLFRPSQSQLNQINSLQDFIVLFSKRYISGFKNKPSLRSKKTPATIIPDPLPVYIFNYLIKNKGIPVVQKFGSDIHQLYMNIENIVGELLEEYIESHLTKDWVCCWGKVLVSVDFCSDYMLLQVKNSYNSENSSSSRVRTGTKIEKWYRRPPDGNFNKQWNELMSTTKTKNLSENGFRKFFEQILTKNPDLLYIPTNLR